MHFQMHPVYKVVHKQKEESASLVPKHIYFSEP